MSAPRLITAFGETKSLSDWSRDSRCAVSYLALAARLDRHGFTPELALTQPRRRSARNHERLFWQKVHITADCWLWTGPRSKKGYGSAYDGDRTRQAHIIAYEWTVGPIADGLELDHKCRVRHCVNPSHLEPVTHLENLARSPFLRNNGALICKRGHLWTPENTINMKGGGRACRQCMHVSAKRSYEKHRDKILARLRSRYTEKMAAKQLIHS